MRAAPLAILSAAMLVSTACAAGDSSPERLAVQGELRTHDPGLVLNDEGEPAVIFSTGDPRVSLGAVQVRTSPDGGTTWDYAGETWSASTEPMWIHELVPGIEHFWAPEVIVHDGTWYLYYTGSTFGSNRSVIALMTNEDFDPSRPAEGWVDRGEVISSTAGDNYNAIDPAVLIDDDSQGWMAFGSHWGGIFLIQLDFPEGKPTAGAEPVNIAHRTTAVNAIEAPSLLHREGHYYLFVSYDRCCSGLESTYNINVGRAESIEGPYLDADGVDLRSGGGSLLAASHDNEIGPGGASVAGDWIAYHYYDADHGGDFRLAVEKLGWPDDGWPRLTQTE